MLPLPCDPAMSFLGIFSRKIKMYAHTETSNGYSRQLDLTEVTVHGWAGKQTAGHPAMGHCAAIERNNQYTRQHGRFSNVSRGVEEVRLKGWNNCDSIHRMFWKRQNYRDREEASAFQGQGKQMPMKGHKGILEGRQWNCSMSWLLWWIHDYAD